MLSDTTTKSLTYQRMSWEPKPAGCVDFAHATVRTVNVPWGTYTDEYLGGEHWRGLFTDLGGHVQVLLDRGSRRAAYDEIRKHHHRSCAQ